MAYNVGQQMISCALLNIVVSHLGRNLEESPRSKNPDLVKLINRKCFERALVNSEGLKLYQLTSQTTKV